jgi:hypothetical protein
MKPRQEDVSTIREQITLAELLSRTVPGGPDGECREWTGYINPDGYGMCRVDGRDRRAHRLAVVLSGRDPSWLCVCHRCDNKRCINPEHLFVGTYADNNRDMVAKQRASYVSGERHGSARLTAAQVEDVRSKRLSQKKFAALYGVSQTAIWLIQHGKTWVADAPKTEGRRHV